MNARIQCFWVEPTDQVEMSLRRFAKFDAADHKCTVHPYGYHDASVVIGRGAVMDCPKVSSEGHGAVHGDLWPHDDARWPMHCICDREFLSDDNWQFNPDTLYRIVGTGDLMTDRQLPPGAMRDAGWLRDGWSNAYRRHEDGIMLQVKLPDGVWWTVDGPATNTDMKSPGWTREGTVPLITARPSILTSQYHGWLTNGYLEEC